MRVRDGKNLRFEEKNDNTFIQVRNNFLEVLPKEKTLIVDSTKDVKLIHELIIKYIEKVEVR